MLGAPLKSAVHQAAVGSEFFSGWIGLRLAARKTEPRAVLPEVLQDRAECLALAQLAGGKPVRSHHDLIARPQLPAMQDARLLQRLGVRPHRVVIGSRHGEGPVWNDAVEMMTCDRLIARQDRVIDPGAEQQSGVGPRRRIGADRVAQGVEAMHACKMQIVEFGRAAEKMHMRFDEAGQDGAAAGVDDAGAWAFVVQHPSAICDRNDVTALDGDRLGAGGIGIHRQNAGILDNQIGRWRHNFLPFELG